MKKLLFVSSVICLLLTLLPSIFVFAGVITLQLSKTLMLIGTIGWFLLAGIKMNRRKPLPS